MRIVFITGDMSIAKVTSELGWPEMVGLRLADRLFDKGDMNDPMWVGTHSCNLEMGDENGVQVGFTDWDHQFEKIDYKAWSRVMTGVKPSLEELLGLS